MNGGERSSERISAPVQNTLVIRSLLSPEAILDEVTRSFAINPPTDCVLLRTFVNDVYLLTAPRARYVFKLYRPSWRNLPALLWEVDLLVYLAGQGAPVAPAIGRRDGHHVTAFAAPEGVRHGVLFEWAPGEKPHPPFTSELFGNFGRAAGLVHRLSDDFDSPYARGPLDLDVLIDEPIAAIRPFLSHRPEDWAYLVRLAEKVRVGISALAEQGLDWGVCHQDMTLDNVHVTPDGAITFYDFDSGGPGWRSLDFQGIYESALYDRNDHWDAFLSGYLEVRKLSAANLAAIPYFVLAYQLWGLHMAVVRARWTGIATLNDELFDSQFGPRGWWRRWEADHLG